MPTVSATISYNYLPGNVDPIGFQVTLKVYDETHGGAGEDFATFIQILPVNARYWSLRPETSTGWLAGAGHPAHEYDPGGITALWTERISNNKNAPTQYYLKGLFDGVSGFIQVLGSCTQVTDITNNDVKSMPVPIPPVVHP
jgi:hypothetical protein